MEHSLQSVQCRGHYGHVFCGSASLVICDQAAVGADAGAEIMVLPDPPKGFTNRSPQRHRYSGNNHSDNRYRAHNGADLIRR